MAIKKSKKTNWFPLLSFAIFGSGMEKNLDPGIATLEETVPNGGVTHWRNKEEKILSKTQKKVIGDPST